MAGRLPRILGVAAVVLTIIIILVVVVPRAPWMRSDKERFTDPSDTSTAPGHQLVGTSGSPAPLASDEGVQQEAALDEYAARMYVLRVYDAVMHRRPSADEVDKYAALRKESRILKAIVQDVRVQQGHAPSEADCEDDDDDDDDGADHDDVSECSYTSSDGGGSDGSGDGSDGDDDSIGGDDNKGGDDSKGGDQGKSPRRAKRMDVCFAPLPMGEALAAGPLAPVDTRPAAGRTASIPPALPTPLPRAAPRPPTDAANPASGKDSMCLSRTDVATRLSAISREVSALQHLVGML